MTEQNLAYADQTVLKPSFTAPGGMTIHDDQKKSLAATLGELTLWDCSVDWQTRSSDVEQLFLDNRTLPAIVITGNSQIFGVLSRKNLTAALSRPFGREVFIKRPVHLLADVIDTAPVILPAATSIAQALREATSRAGDKCYEPVLVDTQSGIALLEVHELMSAQAILLEQALAEVNRSTAELRTTLAEQQRLANELLNAQQIAEYEATHDFLTNLPNRKLFLQHLHAALQRHLANPEIDCAVLFIDLDRFKLVNDSLGHDAGNELLKEVAKRLTDEIRAIPRYEGDINIVARLSGDEFAVLLSGRESPRAAASYANRAQMHMTDPFTLTEEIVHISASIGVVNSLHGYTDTEHVLRDADIAMYRAKRQGKSRSVTFEPNMHVLAETRLHKESQLRQAVDRQEFDLHYQPTISLPDKEVVSLEALVRWRNNGVLLQPKDFLSIAEETGLILSLGDWVFREACETVNAFRRASTPVNISINLSQRQFGSETLLETMQATALHFDVNPAQMTIEITESCAMSNPDRAIDVLGQLKALGFRISIDDFGTGFSSLSHLHRLAVDEVKIDRSFTANLSTSTESGKIVGAILALADSLGISAVVEGVETALQLRILEEMGCKRVQGFYFAMALPRPDIEILLNAKQPFVNFGSAPRQAHL
jgi:diguanylate cyclase (GGDEF)-like protein